MIRQRDEKWRGTSGGKGSGDRVARVIFEFGPSNGKRLKLPSIPFVTCQWHSGELTESSARFHRTLRRTPGHETPGASAGRGTPYMAERPKKKTQGSTHRSKPSDGKKTETGRDCMVQRGGKTYRGNVRVRPPTRLKPTE